MEVSDMGKMMNRLYDAAKFHGPEELGSLLGNISRWLSTNSKNAGEVVSRALNQLESYVKVSSMDPSNLERAEKARFLRDNMAKIRQGATAGINQAEKLMTVGGRAGINALAELFESIVNVSTWIISFLFPNDRQVMNQKQVESNRMANLSLRNKSGLRV